MLIADEVDSTNAVARTLPAWHAVRARRQTGGRGRTGRHWVSDEGGLWISAVLPCPGSRSRWAILPLAVGWAVIGAMHELGAHHLRLRWPNDIMSGPRKLAGLLVERFHPDTAVVGIGINVFNSPESASDALAGVTARLADLVPGSYTLDDVARIVLRSTGHAHALIRDDRFREIADALNAQWSLRPRQVAVTLSGRGETFTGTFHGIDQSGRLRVTTDRFGSRAYEPAQIDLLREVE